MVEGDSPQVLDFAEVLVVALGLLQSRVALLVEESDADIAGASALVLLSPA
jgi:hypothetical protein